VVCKALLKNTPCKSKWSFDYFKSKSKPGALLVTSNYSNLDSLPAFGQYKLPLVTLPTNETLDHMKKGAPLFAAFDNVFFKSDNPELVQDMELSKFFPGVDFLLNTLFVSGFPKKTLGSPFHAAPNENFFFQCRGRKHWYFVPPHHLKYTGAYMNRGVIYTSQYTDEALILDRLPIYEAFLEEGDFLFNPSYWLHAVGSAAGCNIAVANRVWMKADANSWRMPWAFTSFKNSPFFDTIWYIQAPVFISSIVWQRIFGKNLRMVIQIVHDTVTQETKDLQAHRVGLRINDTAYMM
jgi:hypothetical protein